MKTLHHRDPELVAIPTDWWSNRETLVQVAGYRRWCRYCCLRRTPDLHGRLTFLRILKPVLYQTCRGCGAEWPGSAMTANLHVDRGEMHLRLRGDRWWVHDQVTLEALRDSPSVRDAADVLWARMEQQGLFIERTEGRR